MAEFKQENKDDLTEVNKEIEAYLIKKMEDHDSIVEDDVKFN